MADSHVPAEFSSPFAKVTTNDHTAWVVISTLLGLIYSILFGLVRTFLSCTTGGGKGHADDLALLVSTAFAIAQCSIVLGACSEGFGKAWRLVAETSHDKVQQLYYASFLLFILSLGLSKISVVLFQARLTANLWQRRIFHGLAVFIGMWTAASFLALTVQCDVSHPWKIVGEQCSGTGLRWTVISAFDILIELAITSLACYLVWNLQMTRSRKWTVVSAFAYRLLITIPVAFRLANHNQAGLPTDPTFREVLFVVWTQVELHFSIIFATIPILRPVINSLNTSYSSLGPAGSSNGYGSKGTYELSVLKPPESRVVENLTTQRESRICGAPTASTSAFASSSAHDKAKKEEGGLDTNSIESQGSEQMIIRKQMSWRVEHNATRSSKG